MLLPVAMKKAGFTTGTWSNATTGGGGRSISAAAGQSGGVKFTAPVGGGGLSTVKINAQSVAGAGDWEARLYSDNSGSPGTQVGAASAAVTISSPGDKTFTFASPPRVLGLGVYWVVITPNSGTPNFAADTCADDASYASGRHGTITSITDNLPSTEDFRMEIVAT